LSNTLQIPGFYQNSAVTSTKNLPYSTPRNFFI
jgi:hypothetical protein